MARLAPARDSHHNLPPDSTELVGRDHDVPKLCHQLLEGEGRLVTLTGVGGCGKTRLALRVASTLIGSFKDGVWLVSLAPLANRQLVPHALASVLGIRDRPDRSALDVLVAHLARRQTLLVLDNCEHVVNVCAEVAFTLLHGCPGLRLLATSREPLHVPGEHAWRVPSLGSPGPTSPIPISELVRFPAVKLFVARAVEVQADFTVTPQNAAAVAAGAARQLGAARSHRQPWLVVRKRAVRAYPRA
jgi:predicted ATPase